MKDRCRHRSFALLAGATLLTTGAWAMPPLADAVLTRTETVKYDRAAAATPEGAAELYDRLQQTASRVCSEPAPRARPFRHDPSYEKCMSEALDKAVRQVGITTVSLMHRHGESPATAIARR